MNLQKINIRTTVKILAAPLSVLAFATMILSSCQQQPAKKEEPKIDPKTLVSCDGIGEVKLSYSYKDLEDKFKAANLSAHENSRTGDYTTLWDSLPTQVNIYWKETKAPFVHIKYMETEAPDAPYETVTGLKPGMVVKDVHAINTGMPLTFNNPYAQFDAGLITSFNNGKIATSDPCIGGFVAVTKTRNIDETTLNNFKSEKIVESTHSLMDSRMEVIFARFRVTAK